MGSLILDTLAQPPTTSNSRALGTVLKRLSLKKRARSKYFSSGLSLNLVNVQSSPLIKSYWNSFYCCGVLQQVGNKITGKYCGNRWCLTCNRIRTAKMINGYFEEINKMQRPYFVTLTIPNVSAEDLRSGISKMYIKIRKIKKEFQLKGVEITGIRKLECTYNAERNDYHPHYHFLITGRVPAMLLVNEWLKQFPEANRKAQDYKRADGNSVKELFKYFTKLVTKTKDKNGNSVRKRIDVNALDTIFCSIRNLRVYQPMGIVKKQTELNRFVNKIKNTYEPVKKPASMVIQDEEGMKITAIFSAENKADERTRQEYLSPLQKKEILKKFNDIDVFKVKNVKRKILFHDMFNRAQKIEFEEKLYFKIFFTGINVPQQYRDLTFEGFNKQEVVESFKTFYKKTEKIQVSEDLHELYAQTIEGLPDGNAKWLWADNDWVDISTGETLTNYSPSESMKNIVESISVVSTEISDFKKENILQPNENFFNN